MSACYALAMKEFVRFLVIRSVLPVGEARRWLRLNGRFAGGVAGRILICGLFHFAGSRRASIFVLALEDG